MVKSVKAILESKLNYIYIPLSFEMYSIVCNSLSSTYVKSSLNKKNPFNQSYPCTFRKKTFTRVDKTSQPQPL